MREGVEFHDVFAKYDSGKALLCVIEGEEMWIPKSQIHDDSEVWQEHDRGVLVITEWIAEQKGLL